MNKGLIFLCGLGVGAGGGILGTWYIMNKKIDAIVDETIADFKANYNYSEKFPTVDIPDAGEMVSGDQIPPTHTKSSLSGGPVEVERTRYDELSKLYNKPDPDILYKETEEVLQNAEDVLLQAEHPQDGDEEDIRIITPDEYYSSDNDTVSIIWFLGDNTFIDGDSRAEIDNIAPLLGDVLDSIDANASADDTVYVRNDITGVDIEIDILDERWVDQED